jgi:hypothetical protein
MSGVTVSIPLVAKLEKASSQQAIDTLARNIAQMLLGDMRERIHEQGRKTDGNFMGTYSKSYMKVRIRDYNRTASTRVILSLTRDGGLENDWSIIPLGNATYGLGFKNSFNAQKAEWGEERYGRVYGLTKEEKQSVVDEVNEWIKAQL